MGEFLPQWTIFKHAQFLNPCTINSCLVYSFQNGKPIDGSLNGSRDIEFLPSLPLYARYPIRSPQPQPINKAGVEDCESGIYFKGHHPAFFIYILIKIGGWV